MLITCPKGHKYDDSYAKCPFCSPSSKADTLQNTPADSTIPSEAKAKIIFCPNGHAYDSNSYAECPFCSPSSKADTLQNTPADSTIPSEAKVKIIFCPNGHAYDSNSFDECPFCQSPPPVKFLAGWLVCVEGPDIGQDFRLHAHFNHVGRAEYQDVCLSDETVSKEHFIIAYDKEHDRYLAEMNKGSTMVYVNDRALDVEKLKKGDKIKVGNTLLVFIPLEQQDVKWN